MISQYQKHVSTHNSPSELPRRGHPALLHHQVLTRTMYRQGMSPMWPGLLASSQNVLPSQSLQICIQAWGCGWHLLQGNADSLALGILHLIFAAWQWSQRRVKAPPAPSNNFSKEEHWISKRALRGTASHELPLICSKEG